jgi:hypothetical protein
MGKIQPGKSTREDVLRDWEWCNAHLDSNRLFVGKVVHSKTKNIDMMGPIYMGSEGRQWDDENLFVEFDDKGTVTKAYLGSHRDFLRQISSWVRQTELPPLDLSKPIQIKGTIQTGSFSHKLWALHGVVLLAAEGLDFRSEDENGPHLVHVNIGQVEAIGGDYWSGQHLKLRGVPGWSNVNLELTMPDVFLLVRYLKQVREPALPRS